MIYRLSLSQRLTLVFTAIMLICAVAVSIVQIRSSKQYGDAMGKGSRWNWQAKLSKVSRLLMPAGRLIGRP